MLAAAPNIGTRSAQHNLFFGCTFVRLHVQPAIRIDPGATHSSLHSLHMPHSVVLLVMPLRAAGFQG